MIKHLTAAAVLPLLLAMPAFADCSDELKKIEQTVVSAETGVSGTESGMPATQHQEEVLAGQQEQPVGSETTGSTNTQEAISPHQEEVLRDVDVGERPAELMAEARKLAEAGDEQGCMEKLTEIRSLVGVE
ncbi:hypothetical protein [Ensifer sp. LCM 4579]|uniref:hypothetical protein n=1 Tax=Ensifer sp. LCM 4579 TaxID=1848292 RepID=UPI0008D9C67B|nr:hypothetical protein [Ensifer sp. LCM 4579]OHV78714.1 hypothetical protein LCM4579_24935 [Ensifer sp. LCM 4579]